MGQEPEFFAGGAGERDVFKGPGTDVPSDVGSPASIMASWQRKRRETEVTMPGAEKGPDTDEEAQNIDASQQYYDMQQR